MLTVTATDLPRLMACNGSRLVTVGDHITPTVADDTVRNEGIAADWVVEQVQTGKFTAVELVDRKAPNGVYITPEMPEHLSEYLDMVCAGGVIETETSFAGQNWQINGRADHIFYDPATATLYINDLKYGWSIVDPFNNWTLIAHALGFWLKNPGMRIATVVFTIYQPRPHHPNGPVRSWSITGEQLVEFYNQINATLSDPSDMLQTGEHCRNCPALATCPAARKAQYNAIEASDNAFVDKLNNAALSQQLDTVDRAIKTLEQLQKAYKDLALHRLRAGQIIENYSIENELTNRQWLETVTPEMLEMFTGKDLTKKQLITPKQAETAGVSKEIVAALTERKQKSFKVVRISANAKAEKIFNQPKKGN